MTAQTASHAEELLRRTRLPWKVKRGYPSDKFEPDGYRYVQFGPTSLKSTGTTDQLAPHDAELIVFAVNALPVLLTALEDIHGQQGKVCDQYEICEHQACQSSYSAWAIADAALRRLTESSESP